MRTRYSLSILALAVAFVFSTDVQAQDRQVGETQAVTVDIAERGGDSVVVRRYDPDGDATILGTTAGGYVFGTNGYGDRGKTVALEAPFDLSQVVSVDAYIFRSNSPGLSTYDAVVYAGDEFTGPLTELARQEFDIFDIPNTRGGMHPHVFDEPVAVVGSFHVGFEWDHLAAFDDDIAMVSNTESPTPSPYEWEMWDDGVYREVAASWGTNGWHVFIEAVVQNMATSSEDGAQPQQVRVSAVFPNPVNGRSHVEIDVETAQHVTVEVFNLLGQRVATLHEGVTSGRSLVSVDGADLSAGMYIVRIQGEDFTQSRKFVVAN